MHKKKKMTAALALILGASLMMNACGAAAGNTGASSEEAAESETQTESNSDTGASTQTDTAEQTDESTVDNRSSDVLEDNTDGGHVIEADGTDESYENIRIVKTGDSDEGDEADFYGDNAAVFATNGAALTLSGLEIETNGKHANAVFSYGEGTTVTISDSTIETSGDCSGGLMTTGGGTMNAENLTIHTTGNSSAAIRSDRGGGTVTVTGGTYTTDGTGSPAIYSTADITVSDATLTSTASQGVVVEGKNSVTLNNVDLTADNTTKNSDKSDTYQAVMIYQSMSGDAAEGEAEFEMTGGSITNKNGDIFFVNNTIADIELTGVTIINEDESGVLLRAEAAGWGNEGSNGGQVDFTVESQALTGDIVVDDISKLNFELDDSSTYEGAINSANSSGSIYVELESGSTWTLTGDSYITSLTCDADSIDLNGYTLYVNGQAYEAGTASAGEEVEFDRTSQSGTSDGQGPAMGGEKPDGEPPQMPNGERPEGAPPEKPDGTSDTTKVNG